MGTVIVVWMLAAFGGALPLASEDGAPLQDAVRSEGELSDDDKRQIYREASEHWKTLAAKLASGEELDAEEEGMLRYARKGRIGRRALVVGGSPKVRFYRAPVKAGRRFSIGAFPFGKSVLYCKVRKGRDGNLWYRVTDSKLGCQLSQPVWVRAYSDDGLPLVYWSSVDRGRFAFMSREGGKGSRAYGGRSRRMKREGVQRLEPGDPAVEAVKDCTVSWAVGRTASVFAGGDAATATAIGSLLGTAATSDSMDEFEDGVPKGLVASAAGAAASKLAGGVLGAGVEIGVCVALY